MKTLPKRFDYKELESKIYSRWQKSGYFNPDKLPRTHKNPYTIVIPPPNVTGSLHMGHALNATIQDILIRWQRMWGRKTLWLPGTDHAGIATQNVVEKELKKEGKTRHDLGREKFLNRVWEWKDEYGDIILNQLKKLGASADWSRTRFTMDKKYQNAVTEAFIHYYKKGWIYKGKRLVHWCPRCTTSISDLEVEYEEEKGKLWYIRYKVKSQKSKIKSQIIVATTRPETMLGDSAIAVNPKDKRYKKLAGKTAVVPLINREIPIITDKGVDAEFGTGAVKVTPAHDELDFEIGKRHKLPAYEIINKDAKMIGEATEVCGELDVSECRKKVIKELEEKGALEKTEDYEHRVGHCFRCDVILESLLSEQWFLKMDKLAQYAKKEVRSGRVKFHPKKWEKVYLDWLQNIKDWNISRQIWWGHRLPVWEHEKKCIPISGKEKEVKKCEDIVVSKNKPECQYCQAEYTQVDDVLDTWFSSALWPFATMGWPIGNAQGKPKKRKDLEEFYPTQVLSTARDIINLWVARMVFSGMEFMNKKPFSNVYIHATILTKEGKRMSKSLGTGVDPLKLIDKYGSDATRFGLIWQEMGNQDIHFDEGAMIAGQKFTTKIWNAARFVLAQTEDISINPDRKPRLNAKRLSREERRILKELAQTQKYIEKNIDSFRFGHTLHKLYDFFWHTYCDKFIEEAKKSDNAQTKKILLYVLSESLKMIHVFMPFVTEELWQKIHPRRKKPLIIEKITRH